MIRRKTKKQIEKELASSRQELLAITKKMIDSDFPKGICPAVYSMTMQEKVARLLYRIQSLLWVLGFEEESKRYPPEIFATTNEDKARQLEKLREEGNFSEYWELIRA